MPTGVMWFRRDLRTCDNPEPLVDHSSERAEALRRYHGTKSPAGRST